MDYRNPTYTSDGFIDCEIDHPTYGWIQFTCDPDDAGAEFDVRALFEAMKPHAAPYVPPPEPSDEEKLAAERAEMRCSPSQMRLTLHRMGFLAQIQAIADADPEASIVWEYATIIERNSPLIEALSGDSEFTPEQIDDIFRAAMQG